MGSHWLLIITLYMAYLCLEHIGNKKTEDVTEFHKKRSSDQVNSRGFSVNERNSVSYLCILNSYSKGLGSNWNWADELKWLRKAFTFFLPSLVSLSLSSSRQLHSRGLITAQAEFTKSNNDAGPTFIWLMERSLSSAKCQDSNLIC